MKAVIKGFDYRFKDTRDAYLLITVDKRCLADMPDIKKPMEITIKAKRKQRSLSAECLLLGALREGGRQDWEWDAELGCLPRSHSKGGGRYDVDPRPRPQRKSRRAERTVGAQRGRVACHPLE